MADSRTPFPTDPQEFAADHRISFDKGANAFHLEDEDGQEWEWLDGPSKWTKTMDEDMIKQQAEIYKMAGVDEDAPAVNPAQKRKQAQLEDLETNPKGAKSGPGANARSHANAKPAAASKPRQNKAVFVTGLPQDVDTEEIREVFGKYGMLAESVDNDEKRIKLYNDKEGNFKGEALIIYHRPESVELAITMMDGAFFPREDASAPTGPVAVNAADTTYKAHQDDQVAQESRPGKPPKISRAQALKKTEEMNSRLADWDDDDPSTMKQTSKREDKVVIIKGVFMPEEFADDKGLLNDIQEDMKEGAEPHGKVKNVTVFDLEPEGVVTVRFDEATAAEACAKAFNGRSYNGGRKLKTSLGTGKEKFKKTLKTKEQEEQDEEQRLEEYSNYIEGKGGENGAS